MRIKLPLTALTVAVAISASGCLVEDDYSGNPEGNTIAVIGDGTVATASDDLHSTLDDSYRVRLAGTETDVTGLTSVTYDFLTHDVTPSQVVFNAGAYDIAQGDTENLAEELFTMVTLPHYFAATCVHVVTIPEVGPTDTPATAALNEAMMIVPPSSGEALWNVVDWAAAVEANPGYVDASGKPTAEGAAVYADLVSEALASCPAPPS
jgi:hypothetical protein